MSEACWLRDSDVVGRIRLAFRDAHRDSLVREVGI